MSEKFPNPNENIPEVPKKENIGKIAQTKDPIMEKQLSQLENNIAGSRVLSGIIGMIQSPHFKEENLDMMIMNWNKDQKEQWAGGYVEKEFTTTKGKKLIVMMDRNGSIRLGS